MQPEPERDDAGRVPVDPKDDAGAIPPEPSRVDEGTADSPPPGWERIALGDRVFAAGNTGEGKSELVAHLFAAHTGQRILIDVQDHYELGPAALAENPPPLDGIDDVRDIDWRHRTIRYVPRKGSAREYNDLYGAIFHKMNVFVWGDEMEDIAPSSERRVWVKKVTKQGRKYRITHAGASQRPAGVERSVYNQAEHLFLFRMVDVDDITALSYRLGLQPRALANMLGQLPQYGYYRHRLGHRLVVEFPPLPQSLIALTRQHVIIPAT